MSESDDERDELVGASGCACRVRAIRVGAPIDRKGQRVGSVGGRPAREHNRPIIIAGPEALGEASRAVIDVLGECAAAVRRPFAFAQ